MNLYTTNGENKINYYRLKDYDVQKRVLGSYDKPTIVREENCLSGEEDRLFFQGDNVYFMTLESREYLGRQLQSNIGVACSGCDHYYEDAYRYNYVKHFLISELASAIQGYYAARNLDIPKARACLNRIGKCLECDTIDILMMMDILDSLAISESRTFTSLDEFAYFVLKNDDFDCVHNLHDYKDAISGLTIKDLCLFDNAKSSYILYRLRKELASSSKVQSLLDFMPEVRDKRRELSITFERCRKRKGY